MWRRYSVTARCWSITDAVDFVEAVRRGLPFASLSALASALELDADDVDTVLGLPARTLAPTTRASSFCRSRTDINNRRAVGVFGVGRVGRLEPGSGVQIVASEERLLSVCSIPGSVADRWRRRFFAWSRSMRRCASGASVGPLPESLDGKVGCTSGALIRPATGHVHLRRSLSPASRCSFMRHRSHAARSGRYRDRRSVTSSDRRDWSLCPAERIRCRHPRPVSGSAMPG